MLHSKVGDILMRAGKLDEALAAYRADFAIAERLAAAEPGDLQWQSDLSVSYDRLGDVLAAQGKREDALQAYRASLAIRTRLTASRSQQCAVAVRSVGVAQQDRRRAAGRRSGSKTRSMPTAPALRFESVSPPSIAATRSGSAICRRSTTRSAMC